MILAGITVAVISLVGGGGEPASGAASLNEATICSSVDSLTAKPLDSTDIFSADVSIIYSSVKLIGAPPGTEVSARWVYVRGEAKELTNSVLHEEIRHESGTKYIAFSLSSAGTGFQKGYYSLRLYINGDYQMSIPFTVQ